MDDLKDRRGYCELKEEAADRTMWRNRFARGFGPVTRQITDDDPITQSRSQDSTVHTETAPQATKSAAELPAAARRSSVTVRYLITLSDPEMT